MAISVSCECGKRYNVDEKFAGRTLKCKQCNRPIDVPETFAGAGRSGRPLPVPEPGGQNTFASNPARVRVDWGHFLACFPQGLIVYGAGTILGVILGLTVHPAMFLIAGASIWTWITELNGERHRWIGGDVNPGVVVSDKPWLVAVLVDMSCGGGPPAPFVKVLKQPLGRMAGDTPEVGMQLATVAVYHGNVNRQCWSDVHPVVVNCGTRDPNDIQRVMASIPARQWQALDRALEKLPSLKPGLYDLRGGQVKAAPGTPRWAKVVFGLIGLVVLVRVALWLGGVQAKDPQEHAASPQPQHQQRHVTTPPRPTVKPPVIPSPRPAPQAPQPTAPVVPATPAVPAPTADAPTPEVPSVSSTPEPSEPSPAPEVPAAAAANFSPKVGEKIEADDKGTWRIATVLKREGRRAYIHWDGWSDSWDEWVGPERMRPRPGQATAEADAAQPAAPAIPQPDNAPAATASVGEKIEVKWGSSWYPATVVKREGRRTLIHYDGWSDAHDEWVGPDRMRPRSSQ